MISPIPKPRPSPINCRHGAWLGVVVLGIFVAATLAGCAVATPDRSRATGTRSEQAARVAASRRLLPQNASSQAIHIRIVKTAYKLAWTFAGNGSAHGVTTIKLTRAGIQPMARALSRAGINRKAYKLVVVEHSLKGLLVLTKRLDADQTSLVKRDIDLVQWGPGASSDTVVAYISHYNTRRADALHHEYGGASWITVRPWRGAAHGHLD